MPTVGDWVTPDYRRNPYNMTFVAEGGSAASILVEEQPEDWGGTLAFGWLGTVSVSARGTVEGHSFFIAFLILNALSSGSGNLVHSNQVVDEELGDGILSSFASRKVHGGCFENDSDACWTSLRVDHALRGLPLWALAHSEASVFQADNGIAGGVWTQLWSHLSGTGEDTGAANDGMRTCRVIDANYVQKMVPCSHAAEIYDCFLALSCRFRTVALLVCVTTYSIVGELNGSAAVTVGGKLSFGTEQQSDANVLPSPSVPLWAEVVGIYEFCRPMHVCPPMPTASEYQRKTGEEWCIDAPDPAQLHSRSVMKETWPQSFIKHTKSMLNLKADRELGQSNYTVERQAVSLGGMSALEVDVLGNISAKHPVITTDFIGYADDISDPCRQGGRTSLYTSRVLLQENRTKNKVLKFSCFVPLDETIHSAAVDLETLVFQPMSEDSAARRRRRQNFGCEIRIHSLEGKLRFHNFGSTS